MANGFADATYSASSDAVWYTWNNVTTGSSGTGDAVWRSWADDCTSTATSSGNTVVWEAWTSPDSGACYSAQPVTRYREAPGVSYTQLTEEEKRVREEQAQQARVERMERIEAERLEKEAAQKRAQALLKESLDAEQLDQLERTNWFFVKSQLGKRYRIRHQWAGNVDEIDEEDRVIAEFCIHPQDWGVPVEDSMLIQKLMLEADEPRFLQIANRMGVHNPQPMAH